MLESCDLEALVHLPFEQRVPACLGAVAHKAFQDLFHLGSSVQAMEHKVVGVMIVCWR